MLSDVDFLNVVRCNITVVENCLSDCKFATTLGIIFVDTQRHTHHQLPKESKKTLNGTHILIAEDNEINMEISEFFLTNLGAAVEKAWNGQDALTRFQQSEPGTYDAILMDIMMPVMDGLEATRCIRMLNRPDAKKIPIIAMTAQTATDSIVTCRAAGMNAHISKPATKEQLGKILFTLLEKDQK